MRDLHRVLPGQAVDDEQGFGRRGAARHRLHLVHQLLVDVEAARGVEHQDVEALKLGRLHRALRDFDRPLTRDDRQGRDVDLLAEDGELFLRGGAIDVERRHQHLFALFFLEPLGDLGGGGGLTRALQADHHDDRGRGDVEIELGGFGTEHFGQRVADDLDHLLARGDRAEDVLADRKVGDLIDEAANDGQRDVGLKQRDSHFAHRGAHVGLGQRTATAELPENIAQPIAQTIEHRHKSFVSMPATQNTPVSETSPTSGYPWTQLPSRTSICSFARCGRTGRHYTDPPAKASERNRGRLNPNFTAWRA